MHLSTSGLDMLETPDSWDHPETPTGVYLQGQKGRHLLKHSLSIPHDIGTLTAEDNIAPARWAEVNNGMDSRGGRLLGAV
jgi:hypothetical protein